MVSRYLCLVFFVPFVCNDLINVASSLLGEKYQWYTELVDASGTLSSRKEVERVFTVFASEKTVDDCKLLSQMLIDWIKVSKMAKPDKKNNCPYLEPFSDQ